MLIPLLYAIPSLWFGALVTFWLDAGVRVMLGGLPFAVLEGMHAASFFVLASGILLAGCGMMMTIWEVTKHIRTPYNMDAMLCFMGGAFVLLAFAVSPQWEAFLGYAITTLFFAVPSAIGLLRLMMKTTQTAVGSLGVLLIYVGILAAVTALSL